MLGCEEPCALIVDRDKIAPKPRRRLFRAPIEQHHGNPGLPQSLEHTAIHLFRSDIHLEWRKEHAINSARNALPA